MYRKIKTVEIWKTLQQYWTADIDGFIMTIVSKRMITSRTSGNDYLLGVL